MEHTDHPLQIDPQALFQSAISAHQMGNVPKAIEIYRQLMKNFSRNALLLYLLGTAESQRGNALEAVDLLSRSLEIEPNNVDAHNNKGNALKYLGRLEEAAESYDRAIHIKPDYAQAHQNKGNALQGLRRFEEAMQSYDLAIQIKPDYSQAHNNKGNALQALRRLEEAVQSYDRAIQLQPDSVEAYFNKGNALQALRRLEEAVQSYDRAIQLKPGCAEAYRGRGDALHDLRRLEEAVQSYDRAIQLKPDYVEAYSNRGNALQDLRRLEEALQSYDRAIQLKPDCVEAYSNRGNVLQDLRRLEEALQSYDRAIQLKPDCAEAYWNKSLVKIIKGDFIEGWKLYEWRWKRGSQKDIFTNFPQPLWLGDESVADKTVLIRSEQGLGDIIHSCRYVPMVEKLGAKVLFEVPSPLVALVSTLKCHCIIIEKDKKVPFFDLQCPIMSLPLVFKTTVQTIPSDVPYLYPDMNKLASWKKKLSKQNKIRVGIAWSGSARQKNDYYRSIDLGTLCSLFELPVEFHSLQKNYREKDKLLMDKYAQLQDHQQELVDLSDTAALICALDLVISVDTAVAHLAGALGKTVWILLSAASDYRYLLDRSDCPWYPTATLFRQSSLADWDNVIQEVKTRLKMRCECPQKEQS